MLKIENMEGENNIVRLLIRVFCCTAIAEWLDRTFFYTNFSLSTYISLLFVLFGIFFTVRLARVQEVVKIDCKYILWLLIAWNIVTIIRGIIDADSYWDWKFLLFSNTPALLIPMVAYLGNNVHSIMRLIRYIFPMYFYIILLTLFPISVHQIVYLWTPIYLIILCFPYLKNRQRLVLIILILITFAVYFSARSNTIRIIVALAIALSYRFVLLNPRFVSMLQIMLFVIPIVLLGLGVCDIFNVFDMQSYVHHDFVVKGATGEDENMLTDTRTFLYQETLSSMDKHGSFLFGEGGCGKYESLAFKNKIIGAYRYASEVGFLNTLLYSGILGVFLYGWIFYKASRLAICYSNNALAKLIGLFVIFRWNYFFVEEFTKFNTNFFFFWLMIGMCLSPVFRGLSDDELIDMIQFK